MVTSRAASRSLAEESAGVVIAPLQTDKTADIENAIEREPDVGLRKKLKNNMAIDIGLIAYSAYCKSLQVDPSELLTWQELGPNGRNAWRHAACAVLDYMDQCKEDMEKDPPVIG